MRPVSLETGLLGLLAQAPFLDRLEMASISGGSRGAVYEAVHRLEEGGLAESIPHAADLAPPARRYCLTADGVRRLAEVNGETVDRLLRSRAASQQWRRVLLERLDAIASVYRLASTIAGAAHPIGLRLYRAAPLDAALLLPGGRTLGVVRQGLAADRTAFAKRLWRLGQGPLPGAVLVLTSDEVRLRHARGVLARTPVNALLALERDAALAGAGARVWRPASGNARLDLGYVLERLRPGGEIPVEGPPSQASLPGGLVADAAYAMSALLKPAEKRTLDLLADWPWILQRDMAGLLAVSETRISRLVNPLAGFGLVARIPAAGGRLALTDRGLALLARRDRASVGVARRRWSVNPIDHARPMDWRNVSGGRSRQLLRNLEHTAAVHGFLIGPGPPVPRPGVGHGPARSAPPGLPPLPPPGRPALGQPRRLRRPAPWPGRLGLLPGVGAPRRQARNHGPAPGPLPALLRLAPAHRRPRNTARRSRRLRRRHRRHPLPGPGGEGDGAGRSESSPVGIPPRGHRRPGADGKGLAHPRPLGTGQTASRAIRHPYNHGGKGAIRRTPFPFL